MSLLFFPFIHANQNLAAIAPFTNAPFGKPRRRRQKAASLETPLTREDKRSVPLIPLISPSISITLTLFWLRPVTLSLCADCLLLCEHAAASPHPFANVGRLPYPHPFLFRFPSTRLSSGHDATYPSGTFVPYSKSNLSTAMHCLCDCPS